MNIPITLKVVTVTVDGGGNLTVAVDGVPRTEDTPLGRGDLPQMLGDIAFAVGEPVRVEVHEADGATFTDIVLPPEPQARHEAPAGRPPTQAGGVTGSGFNPGEQVAIAFVVARQTADAQGSTTLRLPAAALAGRTTGLVLVGLDSGLITPVAAAS